MNTKIPNDEIAGVLLDGARRLCDYAAEQWISGKYGGDEDMRQENLRHWSEIRRSLPPKGKLISMLNSRTEITE